MSKNLTPKSSAPKMEARAVSPVTNTLRPEKRAEPSQEQIARRAYEIYLSRGGAHGNHVDDWLQAERELKLGR